ncbi:YebC/PmpR family DNA-binding transcriptional regulator [Patescibacteria group bacterium]|nr:YebC/PmpR family DNA-binding transcriptional regulator [Patescibacteria group bacterium]MBU1931698.1 YebC/PmpR family DNA-binding transcriptional regulator [Patescibacteria group bacterium]
MSGHSKWSTIKRQKGVKDQKRGQLFTKMAKAISIAAKEGNSGDQETNFKLRLIIDRARAVNMPKDSIQKAIDRGLGKAGGGELIAAIYEGFGPEKVGIIAEVVTDNKNRTAAEIKHLFEKGGGILAQPGAVTFMFKSMGEIVVCKSKDPEAQMLQIMDLDVEDVEEVADGLEVHVKQAKLNQLKQALEKLGFILESSELVWLPVAQVAVTEKQANKVLNLLELLDDHDDVQRVFSNIDILINE